MNSGTNAYGTRAAQTLSESSNRVYGSSGTESMIDMSGFFTTKADAIMENVTEETLLSSRIFRTVDGVRIPLQIGTVVVDSHVSLMIYHDHVTADGGSSVQRIYVAVRNNDSATGLVQAAPAHTVMLTR